MKVCTHDCKGDESDIRFERGAKEYPRYCPVQAVFHTATEGTLILIQYIRYASQSCFLDAIAFCFSLTDTVRMYHISKTHPDKSIIVNAHALAFRSRQTDRRNTRKYYKYIYLSFSSTKTASVNIKLIDASCAIQNKCLNTFFPKLFKESLVPFYLT